MLEEAEEKLKRALYKVEEESSKFAKESQLVRKKLFDYEQRKRREADRVNRRMQIEAKLISVGLDRFDNSELELAVSRPRDKKNEILIKEEGQEHSDAGFEG